MYHKGQFSQALIDTTSLTEDMAKAGAAELEDEIHHLFDLTHGVRAPIPFLMTACTMARTAYLLGRQHGMEDAFRSADELDSLTPDRFSDPDA